MEELAEEAKRTGKDKLTIFKSSTFLQREAKARAEEKKEKDESAAKVKSPSSKAKPSDTDFENVTGADIQKWLKAGRHDLIEKYGDYMERMGK
jgi:hypothetical protein